MDALGGRAARRGFTYHAYVPKTIGDDEFPLTSAIAAAAAKAEQAARQLNEDPPGHVSLEALARQLLRAESVASSRIEGLVLSHRRLAKAAFDAEARDITAQSVLANIRALERAVNLGATVEEFESQHIIGIHRTLLEGTRDEHLGGVVREEQNWIGGDATSPRNAEFIPPPPEFVSDLLEDLCAFLNRQDVPAVLQAGIAHVQFETIHPFHDGNGRVGRAIILAVLKRRGVAPKYQPPVSLALAENTDRYVAGLSSFRLGNAEDWYRVFTDAVFNASNGARAFAGHVAELQEQWIEAAGRPRAGSGARRLIEMLPSHPIVNVKVATELLGGSKEQARLAVARLEEAGVLRQTTVGKRNRAWESVGLFDLLDQLERSLGSLERTPRPTH
jgi:Fic family protein